MFLFKGLHSLAAARGDGLRPELLDHLARCEALTAAKAEELSAHFAHDFRQAGPNPVRGIVAEASGNVLLFRRNGAQAADQAEPEGPACVTTR